MQEIESRRQLSALEVIEPIDDPETNKALLDVEEIEYHTRVLEAISRDRWFTRTWVLQERHAAAKTIRLISGRDNGECSVCALYDDSRSARLWLVLVAATRLESLLSARPRRKARRDQESHG